MRQRNHCSSLKGIPKMKLQDSGPSGPKSLQSQNRQRPENRLSISRLDVVNGQRCTHKDGCINRLERAIETAFTRCRASSGINIALPDLISEGATARPTFGTASPGPVVQIGAATGLAA